MRRRRIYAAATALALLAAGVLAVAAESGAVRESLARITCRNLFGAEELPG